MRQHMSRILSVALPAALALILFVFAFVQRGHFVRDNDERQRVETQRAGILTALAAQEALAPTKVAAIQEDMQEESNFLTFLRASADSTNVRIARWTADVRPPDTPKPGAAASLAGIVPLSGTVELSGSYRALFQFLHRLDASNRLFTLNNSNWNRAENNEDVRLSTQITRYIFPATAPAAAGAAPAHP